MSKRNDRHEWCKYAIHAMKIIRDAHDIASLEARQLHACIRILKLCEKIEPDPDDGRVWINGVSGNGHCRDEQDALADAILAAKNLAEKGEKS